MKTPSRIAFLTACATMLIANSTPTIGAPPPDLSPNPVVSEWFKSLKQPRTSLPCCSISDCRRVDYRISDDGRYEVIVDGTWYSVPNRFVLRQKANPAGRAVACYTTTFGYGTLMQGAYDDDQIEILCFVPEQPIS